MLHSIDFVGINYYNLYCIFKMSYFPFVNIALCVCALLFLVLKLYLQPFSIALMGFHDLRHATLLGHFSFLNSNWVWIGELFCFSVPFHLSCCKGGEQIILERERSKNVLTSPPLFGAYSFFDRKILLATIFTCLFCYKIWGVENIFLTFYKPSLR